MNLSKVSYKIACWAFIVVGLGHIATDLISPKTSEQIGYINTMKELIITIVGTETNIYSFYQGFSLIMGLILASYGLINLFFIRNNKTSLVPKNIFFLNILVALVCMFLTVKYLFVVPIILTGLAFFGFTLSFIQQKNQP
ncbi:LIC_13387 family protein [Winogradskyella alexanderae]|uniref:Uncharacterized protein n=1 Tax=Winogradskyella alexanderae TaxID=2877123 RepID=A0ABS7XWW1_9FLAO|nr:hypothetical protein [Winogradskyella alexanderae]MCA0133898.1 hypothetical protein [Winogradskyella alexanderae]